jgi:HK97 gp10 family phage protein
MGMTIQIKVDNTKAVLADTQKHKERALIKCGAAWESYAKQGSPVDTGRLRSSLTHEMEGDDTVAIGTDVEYGIYQELGTSRGVVPKLFLTNAGRMHIDEYINIIASEFNNG